MTMFNTFKGMALAATLAAGTIMSATAANAAVVLSNGGVIDVSGNTGTFDATFTDVGAFSHDFTFTIPSTHLTSATVTAAFVTRGVDVNFSEILLLSGDTVINSFNSISGGAGTSEFWELRDERLGAGSYTLRLNGTSNVAPPKAAVYSGTLNISAVPEPATWGMMIVGFGLVGASMRSRKPAAVLA